MKKTFVYGFIAAAFSISLISCSDSKDEPESPTILPVTTNGAYVLNQGQLDKGVEGDLSFIDYSANTVEGSLFQKVNKRSLGNTPQCGIRYGSKIYLGIYESSTIEVINADTYESIKQIKLSAEQTGSKPRAMVKEKGKIYITMFDGYVARLDTLSLEIDGRVQVGPNPETPAILNNRLYVPNSDGMNWAVGYGTTASIIDLNSFSVTATVTVPLNPDTFISVKNKLYLLAKGDYYSVDSAIYEIDPNIDTLQKTNPEEGFKLITKATIIGAGSDNFGFINAPFDKPEREYGIYDVATGKITTWGATEVAYPNAISIDPTDGRILVGSYVMDGPYPSYVAPGYVAVYDSALTYLNKFNVGSGPSFIFF